MLRVCIEKKIGYVSGMYFVRKGMFETLKSPCISVGIAYNENKITHVLTKEYISHPPPTPPPHSKPATSTTGQWEANSFLSPNMSTHLTPHTGGVCLLIPHHLPYQGMYLSRVTLLVHQEQQAVQSPAVGSVE